MNSPGISLSVRPSGMAALRNVVSTKLFWAMLIAGCLPSLPLLGQRTTGEIVGEVKDASGALVSGASVTVKSLETNSTRTVKTDSLGGYTVTFLPVGSYEVKIEMTGFKSEVVTGVALDVDQVARINVALQVGDTKEAVQVQGTLEALTNTDSAAVGTVMSSHEFDALPMNQRNFMDLIQLDAGAQKPAGFLNSVFNMFGGHANSYGFAGRWLQIHARWNRL